jgi:uncharacterized coiled-coil protein SlyX
VTTIKQTLVFSLILMLTGVAATVVAQQSDAAALESHMRTVRKKVKEKRNSAMDALLTLDADQAKVFRPLQQGYDKELEALGKRDRGLIREFTDAFGNLDAATAESIGKKFFDLERDRLALQEKYLKLMSEQVSPVVAVQFIQLQRRFEAQLETERMKYSPLAE